MQRILQLLKADREKVGKTLEKAFENADADCGALFDAMRYSLDGGGKRIRPCLTLEFCHALGGDENTALVFASALEMIHTYSLIHDDLPCMDDDDLRRGRPTNHKVFGEATAVLAGDALLTLAFETVSSCSSIAPQKAIDAVKILSRAAGGNGMIGGQILDLRGENEKLSRDLHEKMNRMKTGALIKAAALLGCLSADADENVCRKAEIYAENVGLAFQIEDDLLDMAEKGKEEDKTTFLSFCTPDEARKYMEELTSEAVRAVKDVDGEGILCEFAEYLCKRQI